MLRNAKAATLAAVRRVVNRLGIDIVRFDKTLPRSPHARGQTKASAITQIVLGGGDRDYGPNWHNIEFATEGYADKYRTLATNIDIPHDLTSMQPLPVQEGSIQAAYTSHVIEHLKDEHVAFMMAELHRVMKPGGYARISCPNIDLYLRAFLENDLEFFHYRFHPHYVRLGIQNSIAGLFLDVFATSLGEQQPRHTYQQIRSDLEHLGTQSALDTYAVKAPYDYAKSHYHVNWFNPDKLTRMLRTAGFEQIYLSGVGQSYCPAMRDLSVFDMGDPKISLFIECRK